MGNSKHKNLMYNYCHKKDHFRFEYWLQKKKQRYTNITELVEGDEEQCDVLSVTNRPFGNKDRWVIGLDVHSILVQIGRCFLHILQFRGEKSS